MRPRRWSGVTLWLIVERHTALIAVRAAGHGEQRGGQPQRARRSRRRRSPRPTRTPAGRRTGRDAARATSQPVVRRDERRRRWRPRRRAGPCPPRRRRRSSTARTGNSARGIPKVIASRSMANEPMSAWLRRTKRSPSAIERRTATRSSSRADRRLGRHRPAAPSIDRQESASATYGRADAERRR